MDDTPIRLTSWSRDERLIRAVRAAVFLKEQGIPAEIDFDANDFRCAHAIAELEQKAVGTGRIQADGKIGRVAVLKDFRGKGIGSALVNALIDHARRTGLNNVFLNAQLSSTGFYEGLGFTERGEPFIEAGIQHVRMEQPTGNK